MMRTREAIMQGIHEARPGGAGYEADPVQLAILEVLLDIRAARQAADDAPCDQSCTICYGAKG